jgi:hypothetical protein
VFSAGWNRNGQLGDGSTTDSPIFTRNLAPLPVRAGATSSTAFRVFPNPAIGTATATGLPAGTGLTIFDTVGREVTHLTTDATGSAQLMLPAGLYLVRSANAAFRLMVE